MVKKYKLLVLAIAVFVTVGVIKIKLVERVFFPCSSLPTVTEVESIIKEHQNIVDEIKRVRKDGNIDLFIDEYSDKCPGKADIRIVYCTEEDLIKIKQIINSGTFFGVPYKLQNI